MEVDNMGKDPYIILKVPDKEDSTAGGRGKGG